MHYNVVCLLVVPSAVTIFRAQVLYIKQNMFKQENVESLCVRFWLSTWITSVFDLHLKFQSFYTCVFVLVEVRRKFKAIDFRSKPFWGAAKQWFNTEILFV